MAQPALQLAPVPAKFVENAPGRYSVNTECIDCDLCRQIAPANFVRETAQGHSYVAHQPEIAREEAQCREALEACPVEAIAVTC
ncbi:MAG: ferredoxin [Acidobacteria bacterium]|nr:ferredoxin [Acidobacteriota bacterium]MBI3424019.1 ferredoxin [Acidobacteriota bacterium]